MENDTLDRFLVIDLEATCCDSGSIQAHEMEIIEVGACWAMADGHITDRFQSFVRPIERAKLTPFCMALTHIEQAEIDTAPPWAIVATALAEFAAKQPGHVWTSWGAYDRHQIELECARHGIADPLSGFRHQNLKASFAKARKIKQTGMSAALQIVGLEMEGDRHRALADACNIARMLPFAL